MENEEIMSCSDVNLKQRIIAFCWIVKRYILKYLIKSITEKSVQSIGVWNVDKCILTCRGSKTLNFKLTTK